MKLLAGLIMLAATAPFPPPKVVPVTDNLKCDWGPLTSTKGSSEAVLKTDAGPFTVQVSSSTKIMAADGKPLRGLSDLQPGQNVRVYYLVDKGAQAQEIDAY